MDISEIVEFGSSFFLGSPDNIEHWVILRSGERLTVKNSKELFELWKTNVPHHSLSVQQVHKIRIFEEVKCQRKT